MTKLNQWLVVAGVTVGLCMSAVTLSAQNQGGGGGRQGRGGGQGPGGGNFDPAQFQQRMMDRVMEQLEITDDAERKVVQPLVQKVMDARMAGMGGMGRGMGGGGRRPGGDNAQGDQGQQRPRFGPAPSTEDEALQKAIDSKASNAELKAAMAKVDEARKAKQAELEKAQANLRKVLSVRQEAIAKRAGWM
jgi:hypothetical protein